MANLKGSNRSRLGRLLNRAVKNYILSKQFSKFANACS